MKSAVSVRAFILVFAGTATALAQPATAPTDNRNTGRANAPAAGMSAPPASAYLLSSQVDWVPLIAPPPTADSPEQRADLQAVLDAQAGNRKGARFEQAVGDVEMSCSRITEVLGIALDDKKLPKATAFLNKAAFESSGATGNVKGYWKRPRPFMASGKVERRGDMEPGYTEKKLKEQQEKLRKENAAPAPGAPAALPSSGDTPSSAGEPAAPPAMAGAPAAPPRPMSPEEIKKRAAEQEKESEHTSYPSGHSAFGTMCAILLGEMVPEKSTELFARADEYRRSRMIVGAHFPTDIEGGRILATAAAAVMSQNFAFQRDLAAARTELRAALNLPAELPPPPHAKKDADKKDQERKGD